MTEALSLSMAGGVVGLLFALWTIPFLGRLTLWRAGRSHNWTGACAGFYQKALEKVGSIPGVISAVAIINEAMARQYWPNQDPLGHRFRLSSANAPWITIIGLVDNVRQVGLDVAGRAEMYFPCTQPAASFGYFTPRDLAVRVQGDPLRYAAAVREAVWAVDRNQPVSAIMPMTQFVSDELASRQVVMQLLSFFAGLALLLAAIGLYGLLAYTVVQRMREIGVRIALGAQPRQVLGATMAEGLRLVLAGLMAGTAGAWALTRVMRKLLYGVEATDPAMFGAAAILLVAVGLLACYLPARRAAAIDPMVALRYD